MTIQARWITIYMYHEHWNNIVLSHDIGTRLKLWYINLSAYDGLQNIPIHSNVANKRSRIVFSRTTLDR